MNEAEIDKLRLDDIELFARKYSELFGKHFDKNTPKEKEEFYKEIKEELLVKAPKYVIVDNDPQNDPPGKSFPDRIELSAFGVKNRAIRIHELFHSYNRFGDELHGLKDFESNLILQNLDEGSTEMFAQMLCGNESQDTRYFREVKFTRFLTSIIGERTMICSTRGNPQLLCETTDRLLGTQNFLQNVEDRRTEIKILISQMYGNDFNDGTPVSKDIQILSRLKHEVISEKDEVSMLFDAVEKVGNQKLYNSFIQTDEKYGYDFISRHSMGLYDNKIDPEQPTIASTQQEILKEEIDELNKEEKDTFQTNLEMEIKKFLYDKISHQKHFIDYPEPKYGIYELTPEYEEFSENFKSELDGASERLGGKMGLFGPGGMVNSLENAPYMVNEERAEIMFLPDDESYELKGYRLLLLAEKLNIVQTKELLAQWTEWIYDSYYKERFPDGDEITFREAIEGIKRNLDEKEKGLVDKYKTLKQEKDQSTDFWMRRFSGWYGAIDKASQSVKTKLVKMKADITKTISGKIKETNDKER